MYVLQCQNVTSAGNADTVYVVYKQCHVTITITKIHLCNTGRYSSAMIVHTSTDVYRYVLVRTEVYRANLTFRGYFTVLSRKVIYIVKLE